MRMKSLFIAGVLFSLCLSVVSDASMTKYKKDFDIVNVVESSKLVVVGRVTSTDFVYRQGVGGATTDITLEIEDMIKGDPNDGKDHVKFMIRTGTGVNPRTSRIESKSIAHTPEFAVNERIMVMLIKNQNPRLTLPYGNYFLFRGHYGKRLVTDNKVKLIYTLDGESKVFNLPIDLVKQIGKAANKNKAATIPIENNLKTHLRNADDADVVLPQTLIDSLKNQAQQIIDREAENER